MTLQLPISFNEGQALAEAGLNVAVHHANDVSPGWSERCWRLFREWLKSKPSGFEFLMEDFRLYLELNNRIEQPPSLRAYGFLSVRARKEGLIISVGTAKVSNAKAHSANAGLWRVL